MQWARARRRSCLSPDGAVVECQKYLVGPVVLNQGELIILLDKVQLVVVRIQTNIDFSVLQRDQTGRVLRHIFESNGLCFGFLPPIVIIAFHFDIIAGDIGVHNPCTCTDLTALLRIIRKAFSETIPICATLRV